MLLLEDPGGEPLDLLLAGPMEWGQALRLAVGLCAALPDYTGVVSSIKRSSPRMFLSIPLRASFG